ncbi:MAG: DUF5622 domain-containing protein [Candidatus Aramenus sp.]|jgi:hypothetical protein|nr:DUF5622 domain-containing protein [Candidatus Aramenus sp.]
MTLKHKKYVYIDTGKGFYVKARVLKNRDENSAESYVLLNITPKAKPRKASVLKLDNLPLEIKEKVSKMAK